MMSLWDALRMNMMISYQELVRTFPSVLVRRKYLHDTRMTGKLVSGYKENQVR